MKQKKNFKAWVKDKIEVCKRKAGKKIRRLKHVLHPRSIRRAICKLHPREVWRRMREVHYFHWILIAAVLASLALSVFRYRLSIVRALQNLGDLWDSLRIYLQVMMSPTMDLPEGTVPRITQIPDVDLQSVLPFDLQELQRRLRDMWGVILKKEYFVAYFRFVIQKSYFFLLYALMLPQIVVLLWIPLRRILFREKTDHGKDTAPLRWWKMYPERALRAVRRWVLEFWDFFMDSPYNTALKWIWLINFNLVTVCIGLAAFYLYFSVTFSFKSFFVQIVRLLLDGLISLFSTPFPVWVVIGWILFDRFRREIGFWILRGNEAKNCDFLKKLPVVSMILGTMGTGKTTMLTDAGLSQQNVFREKAKDLLFKADLKFPDFPWQKFEDALRGAIEHHKRAYAVQRMCEDEKKYRDVLAEIGLDGLQYWEKKRRRGIWSLPSCRAFVRRRRALYEASPTPHNLFGYDLERYASTHEDGLTVTELFDVLEEYAQLYYLYFMRSPLIVSNYSVRSDAVLQDIGNFPKWDMDFFKRDVRDSTEHSENAHVVDFDILRLGNLVDPENPRKGSFEFGVVLLSEIGKERGNSIENRGQKKTDDKANAVNDGFNSRLKMSRHAAVIANHPFIKILTDEQRAESWGADARDLCKLVTIKERGDTRVAMPFFALEGLIYEIVYPAYKDFYYRLRFTRGDNTLTGYLLKKLFCLYFQHCLKIINTFGYSVLTIDLKDGTTDGVGEGELYEYYLSHKKIYSNRFSTDCYADLFAEASLRASVGLDDYEQYETTRATWEEMERQNSYFVRDMRRQFRENK